MRQEGTLDLLLPERQWERGLGLEVGPGSPSFPERRWGMVSGGRVGSLWETFAHGLL